MMFRIFVWRLFENTKFEKNLLLCFKYKRQRRAHEQTLSKSSVCPCDHPPSALGHEANDFNRVLPARHTDPQVTKRLTC